MSERVKLGEVVPLDTPFSLYIFPTYFCNFKCNYCEHSLPEDIMEKKPYYKKSMSFELFKKAIDDAKNFPRKIKTVVFVGLGEPLVHPQICDMVKYASKSGVAERIEIITNGSLLTHTMSDSLIEAGLTNLRISIQGIDSERYHEICGKSINFEQFVDNIRYFYNHKKNTNVYIKIIDCALRNEREKQIFYDIFSMISDDITVEYLVDYNSELNYSDLWYGEGASGLCQHGETHISEICSQPFYTLYLWPDGSVIPCHNMKENLYTLGNVKSLSLTSLWNGDRHKSFMIDQLKGYKNIPTCCDCKRFKCSFRKEDALDDYVESIKKNFKIKE